MKNFNELRSKMSQEARDAAQTLADKFSNAGPTTTLEDEVANFSAWLTEHKEDLRRQLKAHESSAEWLQAQILVRLMEMKYIETRFNEVTDFVTQQRSKGD